ncbi:MULTISPECIES: VIT1/CCC1 transporter family protein [Actinomyces]|uniref:VIT1/CCC1 transporter family protein n=1 Tax=Actinomyces TaxID=1654 RepID=UPI001F1DCCFA|nr:MULTISPECIES: VIT1/CCC1 transporter family protein [Actinomyces]
MLTTKTISATPTASDEVAVTRLDARAPVTGPLDLSAGSEQERGARTPDEPGEGHDLAARLNWLRAGVLGANDGIVSVAGLVIGVAAAEPGNNRAILVAGVAGVLAGAFSMSAGEYVSVSTQTDAERAQAEREGHDPGALTSAWQAALSSAVSFVLGSLLPLALVLAAPGPWKVLATAGAVLLALALTGAVSARLGRSPVRPAVVRNMAGGALAMAVTWAIGHLIGVNL